MGCIHFSTGHFAEALKLFQRAIDIRPGFYVAHADLKQAYVGLGRTAEAEAANRHLVGLMPNYLLQNPDDSRAKMFYAIALLEVGRREEAIAEGDTALAMSPGDSLMLYNGACLYAQLGDTKKAVATLRDAIGAGVTNYGWIKHDPDFDPIRKEPEYLELMKGQ